MRLLKYALNLLSIRSRNLAQNMLCQVVVMTVGGSDDIHIGRVYFSGKICLCIIRPDEESKVLEHVKGARE